jgi:acetoacetate decarboxylase
LRFVKTSDEIAAALSVQRRPQFLGARNLTVIFETSPDAVAALLPPPLEPSPQPLGAVWISEVSNSNCVGAFNAAAVFVRARFQDVVADYCVASARSSAEAVVFGRELYGEPNKLAHIAFESQDEHVWGFAERHAVRFVAARCRMEEELPRGRRQWNMFYFKYLPSAEGAGLDAPPRLVLVTADIQVDRAARGRGEVVFRDSPHDPVYDIPVLQVVQAEYSEGQTYLTARTLTEADPRLFLPYAFARDDSTQLIHEGAVLHAQAARRTRAGRGQWRKSA